MSASAPRILQSADEAPCGSLMRCKNNSLLLRLWDGTGWGLGSTGALIDADNGWLWSDLDWVRGASLIAEGLTEAECRHLSSLSAADAIAWCEARDKAATVSAKRPQPGDVVPWAEVEDGCLYYNKNTACPFVTVVDRHHQVMNDASDPDIARFLKAPRDFDSAGKPPTHAYGDGATLVARDLGTDPEAWRKAMREWTANGNCPSNTLNPVGSTTAALRYEIKMIDERDAARRERDDARVGWAEQTADAARLRIALQEAQRRLVQAHEDIDTLIAKQTSGPNCATLTACTRCWCWRPPMQRTRPEPKTASCCARR